MARTWADILLEIRRTLRDTSTTSPFWTDAELLRRANLIRERIDRDTEYLKLNCFTYSIAGTSAYDKPDDHLKTLAVRYNGQRVIGVQPMDIDLANATWKTGGSTSETPSYYVETMEQIILYPAPSTAAYEIDLEYVAFSDTIALATDIPFNSILYVADLQQILIDGVLWKCMLENSDQRFAEYKTEFINGITKIKQQLYCRPDELATFSQLRRASSSSTTFIGSV